MLKYFSMIKTEISFSTILPLVSVQNIRPSMWLPLLT